MQYETIKGECEDGTKVDLVPNSDHYWRCERCGEINYYEWPDSHRKFCCRCHWTFNPEVEYKDKCVLCGIPLTNCWHIHTPLCWFTTRDAKNQPIKVCKPCVDKLVKEKLEITITDETMIQWKYM